MEPHSGFTEGFEGGALAAVLDSLESWTGLVDAGGRLTVVNAAWSAYAGPNPFVAALAPGADYLAAVQQIAGSAEPPYHALSLKPLKAGGLWLAVIITPPTALSCLTA